MFKNFKSSHKIFLLIGVFLFKFLLFYKLIDPNMDSLLLISIVSTLYLMFLYCFIDLLFQRKEKWFWDIYIVISFLLVADLLYYSYFNRYITIGIINQIKLLPTVSESIKQIFKIKYFTVMIDLPIVYFILNIGEKSKYKNRTLKSLGIISLALMILFVNIPLDHNLIKAIKGREVFTYNISDIFKQALGVKEKVELSTNDKNDIESSTPKRLFSIGKGRNLIVIQVESLQNMMIDRRYEGQEITPNLNSLIKGDSIYFPNYYQMLGAGNTSDAEFVSHNSLYASLKGQTYDLFGDNYFFGLPWILKDEGYKTMALHGYKEEYWNRNKAYPYQGIDTYISEKNFIIDERIGFGLPDKDFFKQSISYLKASEQPFYSFFITLSNHGPFTIPMKHQKIKLKLEHKNTLFGDYLQSVHYTDEAISQFIDDLKANDMYYNSVIAIYGDHFGLNCKDRYNQKNVSNFLGYDYDYDEMLNVPLIIHIPGEHVNSRIETTGGQIDFMPTILNIMGIEHNNPYIFGQDLINAEEGFVASQTYMIKGSFITDNIIFDMSKDKIYENSRAWNLDSREPVDLETCREYYNRAIKEIDESNYILENDILRYELRKGKDIIIEIFKKIL